MSNAPSSHGSQEITPELIQMAKALNQPPAGHAKTISDAIKTHGFSVVASIVLLGVIVWQWNESNKRYDALQAEIRSTLKMQLEKSTVAIERNTSVIERIEQTLGKE